MWVYDLDSLQFLNVNCAAIGNYGYKLWTMTEQTHIFTKSICKN